MVVLENKKGAISMYRVQKELSKTIREIKEDTSKESKINKLTVWGIQYDDKQYNLEINESKTLQYYTQETRTIQYIFAKESEVDYNICRVLGTSENQI